MSEISRAIGLRQEFSPCHSQIGVIMDEQTHAEQFFTVQLLRLRFQSLILHTIDYCSNCFLPARGRNSQVREGCE